MAPSIPVFSIMHQSIFVFSLSKETPHVIHCDAVVLLSLIPYCDKHDSHHTVARLPFHERHTSVNLAGNTSTLGVNGYRIPPTSMSIVANCNQLPFWARQRLSGVCGSGESHVFIKHVSNEHRHGGSQARVIEEYA